MCKIAKGFFDQKGAEYGFGPLAGESPSILSELPLEKLDKFQTHSKSIENAFGHLDNLLSQSGPQGFQKAVQAMQIAGAKDLVFDESHEWRKIPVSKRSEIAEIQKNWTKEQQQLLDSGVKATDVYGLLRARMLTKLLESLKKHGGPLNSDSDIDLFL